MKKYCLVALLIICLAICLVGCGDQKDEIIVLADTVEVIAD